MDKKCQINQKSLDRTNFSVIFINDNLWEKVREKRKENKKIADKKTRKRCKYLRKKNYK